MPQVPDRRRIVRLPWRAPPRRTGVADAELLDDLRQDLRFALRTLRRSPGFAAVAALTLALGLGATTAIFSVVNGVLLRALPFGDPDRLVRVYPMQGGERNTSSVPDYADFRDRNRTLEGLAAMQPSTLNLSGAGAEPMRLDVASVTANFFPLLRVHPLVGRVFLAAEDVPGAPHVAVLAEALWRQRFGGDPHVVGRTITMDGEPYTVIGVLPQAQRYPARVDAWVPAAFTPQQLSDAQRGAHYINLLGRLRPGATLAAANADLRAIARQLAADHPRTDTKLGAEVVSLRDAMVGDLRRPLFLLLGAVGFVLLIACANVANLMLVRAAARRDEIAIRTALGAGRARLARQLVTESLVLAAVGAAAGIVPAAVAVRAFVHLAPASIARLDQVRMDAPVLAFAAGLTALTGLVFGLAPAVGARAVDLTRALKEGGRGGRGSGGGVSGTRLRGALVVAEVAMAVMLLVGAGLLIESFVRMRRVDLGFDRSHAIVFNLTLPDARYGKLEQQRRFGDQLVERLGTLRGTRAAALAFGLPFSDFVHFSISFTVREHPPIPDQDEPSAGVRVVTPAYFTAMGIPIVRGRAFTAADRAGAPPVMIVNEALVRRMFPGEDPIGKHLRFGWRRDSVRLGGEIVGVIGDVKQMDVGEPAVPEAYAPYDQWPMDAVSAIIRTDADPSTVLAAARQVVRAIDPDLPIFGAGTLAASVSESVASPRFYTVLLGLFAGIALTLAAIGIYGVIAYSVAQRTHEIGVRIALGATRERVVRLVVRQGLGVVLLGVAAGTGGAALLSRVLHGLLFEVSATDPVTFAAVGLLLVLVALAACWLPARRAAGVDPLRAIRAE